MLPEIVIAFNPSLLYRFYHDVDCLRKTLGQGSSTLLAFADVILIGVSNYSKEGDKFSLQTIAAPYLGSLCHRHAIAGRNDILEVLI